MIKAWTDYPILALGDISQQEAPIRECEVHSWNRDKYVWVRLVESGLWVNFKRGYVYTKPGRCGEVLPVPEVVLRTLPRECPEAEGGQAI